MRYVLGSDNARGLSVRFERLATAITAKVIQAERETLDQAQRVALSFSSARAYDMRDPRQRRMAPYSRQRPRPPLPPFMVNIQGGRFERAWGTRFSVFPGKTEGVLYNNSPEARYFTGDPTRRMMGRDIRKAIVASVGPEYRKRMRQVVRQAMGKR